MRRNMPSPSFVHSDVGRIIQGSKTYVDSGCSRLHAADAKMVRSRDCKVILATYGIIQEPPLHIMRHQSLLKVPDFREWYSNHAMAPPTKRILSTQKLLDATNNIQRNIRLRFLQTRDYARLECASRSHAFCSIGMLGNPLLHGSHTHEFACQVCAAPTNVDSLKVCERCRYHLPVCINPDCWKAYWKATHKALCGTTEMHYKKTTGRELKRLSHMEGWRLASST
jgi:hypothetical protein